MSKLSDTFNAANLKNSVFPLLQKIDYSALFSTLKSKVNLSPDYFMEKAIGQLTTMRDKNQRTVNILDYIINAIDNFDSSNPAPKAENTAKANFNLSPEEIIDKTIEFLNGLKEYSANNPSLKDNVSNMVKNNFTKAAETLNMDDYINKFSGILEKLKTLSNN